MHMGIVCRLNAFGNILCINKCIWHFIVFVIPFAFGNLYHHGIHMVEMVPLLDGLQEWAKNNQFLSPVDDQLAHDVSVSRSSIRSITR